MSVLVLISDPFPRLDIFANLAWKLRMSLRYVVYRRLQGLPYNTELQRNPLIDNFSDCGEAMITKFRHRVEHELTKRSAWHLHRF